MRPEKKRILVVDDDIAVLTSLKRLLELSGFEVEAIQTPKDSLSRARSFKPHLILLDLLMPAIGGLEVCEMLNNDKDTNGIPVIIISALTKEEDIKKAYRLGVVGYKTKPYDFSELLKEINKTIAFKEGGTV
ncbi:MAG: response regulator [Candidatus Omnitrophota bacterium]|jgi:CheY-like chemotaxis protein